MGFFLTPIKKTLRINLTVHENTEVELRDENNIIKSGAS